jgi:hypothetical protein
VGGGGFVAKKVSAPAPKITSTASTMTNNATKHPPAMSNTAVLSALGPDGGRSGEGGG